MTQQNQQLRPGQKEVTREDIVEMRRDKAAEWADNVFNQMQASDEASIQKIPEEVFKQNFLPLFTGETHLVPAGVHWGIYAGTAGSPYLPIDVVDAQGEVLYRAPALFDNQAINPTHNQKNHQGTLHDVKITSDQKSHISPDLGQAYLAQELSRRNPLYKTTENQLRNLKVLNEIFARYGKPLIEVPGVSVKDIPDSPKAAAKPAETPLDYSDDDLM